MQSVGAAWAVALALLVPQLGMAQSRVSPVGEVAVQRAQRGAQKRRGGFFRHGWYVATRTALSGALGAGAGYVVGGPSAAMSWGTKAAGAGAALSSMTGGSRTGAFKRSDRCFAKADLAEAKGQLVRKHFFKLGGIVWSGVECGVVNGVTMAGLGCLFNGPAGAIPAGITGATVGAVCGAAAGTTRAYVVPFFKRRSLGWSISRANSALKHLAREPDNPAWQAEATRQLRKVQAKKDRLPRLGWGQARRFNKLATRTRQLSQQAPGLAGLASMLR